MSRGGKRNPTPGKAYSNRTDLNQAPTSTGYGDRVAQERRLQAVPITPPQAPPHAPQQPLQAPGALDRPTDRPMEPITSGLPTGPGPGPEALGGGLDDSLVQTLRVLYQRYPHPDILDLIQFEEERL